jgi:ubiquinone/menaquinone biosynthesis C-methylase UbiE
MAYTQEQLERDGFLIKAAPVDSWRNYDEIHPVPYYFDFDWFSARHPDLYHRFALSSDGLMGELEKLVDLSGLDVIDVGAGTGRSAIAAARRARSVRAVDIYESVVLFGRDQVRRLGLANISYIRGNRGDLPFAASTFDALINSFAELDCDEACRVLKPGGYLIRLGAPIAALCGELTETLSDVFPHILTAVAPDEWFDPGCPPADTHFPEDIWQGLPVIPPTLQHDFTFVADYGDWQEAAAIFGRLYGPKARQYFLDRRQSQVAFRLRIEVSQVRK